MNDRKILIKALEDKIIYIKKQIEILEIQRQALLKWLEEYE